MSKKWIYVLVVRKGEANNNNLLDQLEPPFAAQEGAIINVKGKNWRVVKVSGNLLTGDGEVHVTDDI